MVLHNDIPYLRVNDANEAYQFLGLRNTNDMTLVRSSTDGRDKKIYVPFDRYLVEIATQYFPYLPTGIARSDQYSPLDLIKLSLAAFYNQIVFKNPVPDAQDALERLDLPQLDAIGIDSNIAVQKLYIDDVVKPMLEKIDANSFSRALDAAIVASEFEMPSLFSQNPYR